MGTWESFKNTEITAACNAQQSYYILICSHYDPDVMQSLSTGGDIKAETCDIFI